MFCFYSVCESELEVSLVDLADESFINAPNNVICSVLIYPDFKALPPHEQYSKSKNKYTVMIVATIMFIMRNYSRLCYVYS